MLVVAGTTTSKVNTGNGASLIFAGAGASTVTAAPGPCRWWSVTGKASITEGSGSATYDVVRGAAGGTDVLTGFKPNGDHINLYGYTASQITVSTSGGSSLISLADGTKIQSSG